MDFKEYYTESENPNSFIDWLTEKRYKEIPAKLIERSSGRVLKVGDQIKVGESFWTIEDYIGDVDSSGVKAIINLTNDSGESRYGRSSDDLGLDYKIPQYTKQHILSLIYATENAIHSYARKGGSLNSRYGQGLSNKWNRLTDIAKYMDVWQEFVKGLGSTSNYSVGDVWA